MTRPPNDVANLRRLVDARRWGVTSVVRQAAPRMSQGSITFTSRSLSSRPRPGTAMLTAMRSAMEALAPALALELAPVRVNAVTPGLMDTPLLHRRHRGRGTDQGLRAHALIATLLGTWLRVSELLALERDQSDGRGFINVLRKGGHVQKRIPVQKQHREVLDE